jgi:tetratricopeptide repeat protein
MMPASVSMLLTAILLAVHLGQSPAAALQLPAFGPPTKDPVPPTAAETTTIKLGIMLYDQHKYDEAIGRYEEVLKDNGDDTVALYELALAYAGKKDTQKAIDLAAKGTQYKTPPTQLAQFYAMIGNLLDAAGEPQRAIEVYKKGIEYAPGAGSLYYNMAVTYSAGLHELESTKKTLKQGAAADPTHAGTQLMLGKLFLADDLKTPALFALSRFLLLEPGTARTAEGYNLWIRVLNGGVSPTGQGGLNLAVNPNQKKDEGDLTKLDLFIGLSKAAALKTAGDQAQIQILAGQMDNLLGVYADQQPGDDKGTFLWTYYMPYFAEMKKQNFVEPFVYFVSQRTTLPGTREWLNANRERVAAFLNWSKGYVWAKTP